MNFFWNFICLEQTGLLISSVYYKWHRQYLALTFTQLPAYNHSMCSTVGATYNRRFISVFFWILFRKIFSPALCYIWEIGKPYALDNYNTEGIRFLEFWYDVSFERRNFSKSISKLVETGPIKEKSTNSNFFPHYLEFHMNFFWNSNFFPPFFWNLIWIFFGISYVWSKPDF